MIQTVLLGGLLYSGAGWGSNLGQLELEDQFGQSHSLQQFSGVVLFSASRIGSNVAQQALNALSPAEREPLRYVVDISGMPMLVTKLMALPQLRDLGYPVLLDLDGAPTLALPRQEDQVTLLCVDSGAVGQHRFYADGSALQLALQQPWCRQRRVER
ncbi:hypothetical protein [uncultured Ferrimonas sp.]|uniref:hypothetical protein n=1 Tax=uncultured Ferrimonas sp. TaxID=432640 RepID=UPI00261B5543|nr:hypothetical protein [uncultured Ferrimonas sp.]